MPAATRAAGQPSKRPMSATGTRADVDEDAGRDLDAGDHDGTTASAPKPDAVKEGATQTVAWVGCAANQSKVYE